MRYLFDQVQLSHGARLAVRGKFGTVAGRRSAAGCTQIKDTKKPARRRARSGELIG